MKKIGIFGSSFNPIHMGHLIICEQARIRLDLDRILLVPTKNPYHKKTDFVDFTDRLKMANLSVENDSNFDISDVESLIEGNSYTYNVLKLLDKEFTDSRFYFIMGSDSLINFHTWYKYDELIKMLSFIVFKRPEDEDIAHLVERYSKKGMDIKYFDDLQIQISSTYLRNSLAENKSVKYLVPDSAIDYINKKGLYNEVG